MKTKKVLIISSILVSILLISLLIYFGVKITNSFILSSQTTYEQTSYLKDTIIYSSIDRNSRINTGFTNIHFLSESGARDFETGIENTGFFAPYLESNEINSDNFYAGGFKPLICVFTPNDWESHSTQQWDESDNRYYSVTGDYWGEDYQKIKDLGFIWYAGKTHCFVGNYRPSILNSMADKLVCSVKGNVTSICSGSPIGASDRCIPHSQSYDIDGEVSYNSRIGFICEVNEQELFDNLPKIMVQPYDERNVSVALAGIDGTVEFELLKQEDECSDSDEKCEEFVWYTCTPDNTWGEQGIIRTKCGVECKINNDCENNEICEDYKCIKNIQPNYLLYISIGIIGIFIIGLIFFFVRKK